jgi:titin
MTYVPVATVSAPATRYTDTGRAENTPYKYRLRGANASGPGDYGDPVEVRTLKAPPAPPTGLQLTVASAVQINLTWTNAGGSVDGIRIDRKKSGEAVYTPRTTLAPGATAFQDTGLAPATLYAYRVAAFNNGGDSEPPAAGSATTLPLPPVAPTGLIVTVPSAPAGRTRLEVAWTDASTNETGFALQQSTDGVNWTSLATVPSPAPAATGGTVTTAVQSLNPNTQYRFRVASVNTGGQSAWVGPQAGTTLPLPPAAPSGLSVTAPPKPDGSNRLMVAWTDASTTETTFSLQRSLDGVSWTDLAPVPTPNSGGAGGVVQVTASQLSSDTLYYFRVAATNTGGSSAWVGPQSAKTLPLPPNAPEGLNVAAPPPPLGRATLNVAWTDASSNETTFALQKSLDGVSWTSLPDVPTPGVAESGEVVTAQVDTLQPKTRYYFRVAAVNPGGASAWTDPASAVTLPLPPSAPTGLTVTTPPKPDGLSKLVLSWTDPGPGETGFQVERRGLSGEFASIAQVGPNSQSFTDTGLGSNTQYVYRVRAFNSGGESDSTLAAAGATLPDLPNAPLNLTVSVPPAPAGIVQLSLAWHDGSSNETGFRIERQDADGVFIEIGTAGANHIVYPVTGLQPATAYTFRVRAYNADGNSAPSNTASKTTLPNPPGSPNLTAVTALFPRELRLEWSYPGSDQTGFQVERSTNGSSFSTAASVPADAVSWTDSGLSPATPYYYRVRAVNSGGASAPSSVVSGATLADLYSIRGVVASGEDGVAGVTVSAGGKSAVTAPDGSFALAGLAPGAYQVTPSKSQYVFDPPSRSVTVGPDWDGLRFNAVPPFLFTLDRTDVRGGKPARGRIVLRVPASVATRITLQSSDPHVVRLPAQVKLKKGKGTAAFAASTRRVTATKEVTLSATLGDVTQTVRLTVFP